MRFLPAALALLVTILPQQLPVVQLPPQQSFAEWLLAFRAEASANGISDKTLDAALNGLEPTPVVVERDRSQAELVLTLDQYLQRRLTSTMIATARKMARTHHALLARVGVKYGVPPGIVVSVWGLESNFGRFSGVRPTIATLATLAYDKRRAQLFRHELMAALQILDSGDVSVENMQGSWAGALGQAQFMPSSFLQFAQDFDGDGRRDIWTSLPDVFASIANYLKEHGWKKGQVWGREVKAPATLLQRLDTLAPLQTEGCLAERQMTVPLPLSQWKRLGVTQLSGRKLPAADLSASMVRAGKRQFLLYPNYQAILAYNCVHAYGLSVALLSDRAH
ncbi:MAG TPA: lytic murein transglycosylase [Vicinamibacterales bacterium]|nr:lytic murein transglycosylase [Vicinamibacterales bacterium]